MTPFETRNKKAAETVIKNLKTRHFEAFYCETKEEAREKILSLIPSNDTVGYGGSETLNQLGIKEALRARNQAIYDRDLEENPEKRQKIMKQSLTCGTYLMSTNAITESGELINIDGNGNRVAALIYGPDSVIIAAGMNKLVKSLESAVERARSVAAPINAQRFNLPTPCCSTGLCADCLSEKSICASFVRTRICRPEGRIKVILIGESLGF